MKITQVSNGEVQSKKLNEIGGEGKYHIKVSNRFAALEDLDSVVKLVVLRK
jgi:uncharacterized metal-binding protein YceD (DUF177 family)